MDDDMVFEDYSEDKGINLHESLSELARKLEDERNQLEMQIKVLESENQVLLKNMDEKENEVNMQSKAYKQKLKEIKIWKEKEKENYEDRIGNLENDKNILMVDMVAKEASMKNIYEEKVNKLEIERASLKEDIKGLQLKADEDKIRREKEKGENIQALNSMQDKLKAKDDERKKLIKCYEEELKNIEETFTYERDAIKKKIHAKDLEIQKLKVENAKLKAEFNSEHQQHEREIEKIRHEIMSQALKELEKRLIKERENWRENNGNISRDYLG